DYMISEAWLAQAWEEIRRNQGSQMPGIDQETANDVDLDRIRHLSQKLHKGTYSPKAVRRVYIPKRNDKLRPLGIPMYPTYCIACARVLGIVTAEPCACASHTGPRLPR